MSVSQDNQVQQNTPQQISDKELNFRALQQKYENDMKTLREDMNTQLNKLMIMIQHNPKLSYVKPEILEKINES